MARRTALLVLALVAALSGQSLAQSSQGCALAFNQGRIEVPHDPGFGNADRLTIEAWIEPDGPGTIAEKDGTWRLRWANDSFRVVARIGGNSVTVETPPNFPIGLYYHVAVTFLSGNNSNLRLLVDGSVEAQVSNGNGALLDGGTSPLTIGDRVGGGNFFEGKIDEFRIWSERRTGAELAIARTLPLRSAPGLEFVLAADGSGSGAPAQSPFTDATGQHVGTIATGSLFHQPGVICAPAHPGTGADLIQLTGVDGATPDLLGEKAVVSGEQVRFLFDSPGGPSATPPSTGPSRPRRRASPRPFCPAWRTSSSISRSRSSSCSRTCP
jgi:hypothetical protein